MSSTEDASIKIHKGTNMEAVFVLYSEELFHQNQERKLEVLLKGIK